MIHFNRYFPEQDFTDTHEPSKIDKINEKEQFIRNRWAEVISLSGRGQITQRETQTFLNKLTREFNKINREKLKFNKIKLTLK